MCEIGLAEASNKPILCLFNVNGDFRLSAMISGNPNVETKYYKDLAEAKSAINEFIAGLDSNNRSL